jgi:hypothetical protein
MNPTSVTSPAVLLTEGHVAKQVPLTRLIACLSLCMLAAAFGTLLGPTWSRWWAIFGTFGLASAIGLEALNRSRRRGAEQMHMKQLALQAERKLNEMADDLRSTDAIRGALQHLLSCNLDPTNSGGACEAEPRASPNIPARITRLLQCPGGGNTAVGEPLAARVRNISRRGVGLAHDQSLERGLVVLEIATEKGERLKFIVDVLWCELQNGGSFFSGGKILNVVSPSDERSLCISQ